MAMSNEQKQLLDKEEYLGLKDNLLEATDEFLKSEEFSTMLQKIVRIKLSKLQNENVVLGEIIPKSLVNTLKVYIYNKRGNLCNSIKGILKNPNFKPKVKAYIDIMIRSNTNAMVAKFINADSIYDKLENAIYSYLADEQNQTQIVIKLTEYLDKVMNTNINEVVLSLPQTAIDANVKEITESIGSKIINEALLREIYGKIEARAINKEN